MQEDPIKPTTIIHESHMVVFDPNPTKSPEGAEWEVTDLDMEEAATVGSGVALG